MRAADARAIVLVDQTGASFRLGSLPHRPTIVTFVASRCTDTCPLANVAFGRLERRLRRERRAANLVTITLDPTYDTPYVFARVARGMGADPATWKFASGTPANVRAIMTSFGVTTAADKHGVPEEHSTFVYLLDGHGRLATTLLLSTALDDDVVRALVKRAS